MLIVLMILCFYLANASGLSKDCGKSLSTASVQDWRIIGGKDARDGEFPWQIIITPVEKYEIPYELANFCGGTLISDQWVLTAGHCAEGWPTDSIKIRLGVYNYTVHDQNEFDVLVEKQIKHENFVHETTQDGVFMENDLALIKLKNKLDFNGNHSHLRPVCLAQSLTKLTSKCVATGFGYVNLEKEQRPLNGILQKVDTPLAEDGVCKNIFAHFNQTEQVCAGGSAQGGKAVCKGDSGGPLQCVAEDGLWYQIGIVSYGYPCALPNKPDLFTRISFYYNWIVDTIAMNQ